MGKHSVRPGNPALRKALKRAGFDWVTEMVKLYQSGDLNAQGKLNLLQTIAKYTEVEPKAPTLSVTREERNHEGTKQLKASVVDNLPIEELGRLASGGYGEMQRIGPTPSTNEPPLATVQEVDTATAEWMDTPLGPPPKRRAGKKSGGTE